VGKKRTLPLPAATAAIVLHPVDGSASYRDPPPRAISLATLPGEEEVTRDEDVLRFAADRNWVVVRRRRSARLLRVEVSAAHEGLVLRARRLPNEIVLLLIAAAYLGQLHGPLPLHPLTVCLVLGVIVGSLWWERILVRRSIDGVIAELQRRITAVDPSYAPPPTAAQLALAQGLRWACACGKINERHRKTCRQCWAARA
jgi:hypothetical protein